MPGKKTTAGRTMSVVTRRAGTTFHRAGCAFWWCPVTVKECFGDQPDTFDPIGLVAEVCPASFDRILAEPMLRCELENER